jgi:protease stability complex PrcB-like protein
MTRWPLLCLVAIAGCAHTQPPDVTVVLTHNNCQHLSKGAVLVDYATLAKIRGVELLRMEQPAAEAAAPVSLVAISLGERPTPGYKLVLRDEPTLDRGTLTVQVDTETPPKDAILPQMITQPCIVIGVGEKSVAKVRVEDASHALVGEVALR